MNTKKLLIFLLLLFLPFSCQKSPEKKSHVVHLSIPYDPPTLDPRKSGDNFSFFVLKQCYEGLFRKNLHGEVQPALAERYEVSEDGRRYLFYLRESFWSNGEPLTAYDFERSWKSTLDPTFPSTAADALLLLKNGNKAHLGQCSLEEIGVKALDEKRLQVELEHPAPYFLKLLTHSLFCPVAKPFEPSISNGPFLIKKWKPTDHISLVKNPNYWDKENVKLDSITIYIINDIQTTFNLFEKGQLDWIGYPISNIPVDAISSLNERDDLHFSPYYSINFYLLNTETFPLNHLKIRKALALAINRDEIVQNITQLGEAPAYSLIPPDLLHGAQLPLFKEGPDQAKQLLNQALEELKITVKELPPITLSYNTFETNHKVAQAVQQQWAKTLGIDVKLEVKEWKVYLDMINQGNYQIARMGLYPHNQDPTALLENFEKERSSGYRGNWSHSEFSKLIQASQNTNDSQKRLSILKEAEELLISEMPLIPLYFQSGVYMKNPHLKDVFISPYIEMDLKHAYIADKDD